MLTELPPDTPMRLPTLRDLATPIFRHRRAGLLTAGAVLAATLALIAVTPTRYQSEMKLLVKRERAETIVSAAPTDAQQGRMDVSEDELNSEVEVLKGRDLLEQVALASGLARGPANGGTAGETARAVRILQTALRINPVRKTTLIQVSYAAADPAGAARVLSTLARLYLEKHLELHRPPGAYEFFSEQTARFHAALSEAEANLTAYGRREGVVSAELEKDAVLRELADFETTLQQTRAAIDDSTRRIADLVSQVAVTPQRQTTEVRTSDNAELTGALKSRILDLEMKQADLARKFAPTYPPVIENAGELAQARAALQRTEQAPVKQETTNQNPTHQWMVGELARVRTERAAALARVGALTRSIDIYRERARRLDDQSTTQQGLRRVVKAAEDNFLLYQRKQEEARISDALDRTRIANVVVAEAPSVPTLPANSSAIRLLILGSVAALLLGLTATFVAAYISPFLHTADDAEESMGVPVLGILPAGEWPRGDALSTGR